MHAMLGTSKAVQVSNSSKAEACRRMERRGPRVVGGCPGACKRSALSLAADCGSGGHQIENIDARKASGG